jgi:hypothetical protein
MELEVRDKVAILDLLVSELFRVDVKSFEIGIKSGLARKLANVELSGPEGMLSQMLPVDTLRGVLLQ